MEKNKLEKQIKKLAEDVQINLLNNVCNYLGIADTRNELKSLFIEGTTNTTPTVSKKNNHREPSEYNKFVKSK